MRRSLAWILAATFALAATAVFAEDDGPAFSAADLAVEEDALPDGWSMTYDEVEDSPGEAIEEWANEVARGSGIDERSLFYEIRVLESPEKAHATLLLVEVDGDPGALPARLERAAKENLWSFRTMGHPSRLLVLAAPASIRDDVMKLQLATSVRTLTRLAHERHEAGSLVGAEAYANGALAIEPKAGMPHAVQGLAAAKVEKWEEAVAAFDKAFDKGKVFTPEGELAHRSWRTFGYALLKLKKKEADEKAVHALEQAIATADVLEGHEQTFAIHYNLACALSRLGRVKPACQRLEEALEMAKKRLGPQRFSGYLNNTVRRDPDLENIRGKSCYDEVLERVTRGVATSPLDGI